MELVHYKIDCVAKFNYVADTFRRQTFEVMRHNLSLKFLDEKLRLEIETLHADKSIRNIKDQLYATSHLRNEHGSDNVDDDATGILLNLLFQANGQDPSKVYVIGPSKSGKSVMCAKLVVRVLASKHIKKDFGCVPVLISIQVSRAVKKNPEKYVYSNLARRNSSATSPRKSSTRSSSKLKRRRRRRRRKRKGRRKRRRRRRRRRKK